MLKQVTNTLSHSPMLLFPYPPSILSAGYSIKSSQGLNSLQSSIVYCNILLADFLEIDSYEYARYLVRKLKLNSPQDLGSSMTSRVEQFFCFKNPSDIPWLRNHIRNLALHKLLHESKALSALTLPHCSFQRVVKIVPKIINSWVRVNCRQLAQCRP